MPSSCGAGSAIIAQPSGTVLAPKVDPPAGTTSVVLKCNVGLMGAAKDAVILDTQVFVSANSTNGATFTENVRTYGATDAGVTTARPDGPHQFGPFEITAAPRYDIAKTGTFQYGGFSYREINGQQVLGKYLYYNVTVATDRKTGVEAFQQPVKFEDSLWGQYVGAGQNGADATVNAALKWYLVDCYPHTGDGRQPQGTSVYGKVGMKNATVTNGPVSTTENSVRDSGTCSFQRQSASDTSNYDVTLTGIDTTGATYPTKSVNGTTLPADKYYVASYEMVAFVPRDEIDKMTGAANDGVGIGRIWNRVGGFDPNGMSGASNFGSGTEPGYCAPGPNTDRLANCATMPNGNQSNNVAGPAEIKISPGVWSKEFADVTQSWGFRSAPPPGASGAHDGRGQVQPGQTFTSRVKVSPESPNNTNLEMCDVFDNSTLKISPLGKDQTVQNEQYGGAYAQMAFQPAGGEIRIADQPAFQKNFQIRYGHVDLTGNNPNTGVLNTNDNRWEGDWSVQAAAASGSGTACGKPGITFYDNPNDVPGGLDAVNVVWAKAVGGYVQPVSSTVMMTFGLEQRNTYNGGPHAGEQIPANTISANFGNIKSDSFGTWSTNRYIPGAGNTGGQRRNGESGDTTGDRWSLVRAEMAIKKWSIAGNVNGEDATGVAADGQTGTAKAGTPVIWNIRASLTAASDPAPPVTNVVITDTLPAGVDYDADATAALADNVAPSSATVNANGTTTLVWNLGSRTPNATIPDFRVVTRVDPFVANNVSLVNNVNIKADGIVPIQNAHNDGHTVTVQQPGSLQLKKSVDQTLDLQNQDQAYTLQIKNFSDTLQIQAPTIIDVLPYNGDATNAAKVNRNPASKYAGTNTLVQAPQVFRFDGTTPAAGTMYYTTVPAAQVPQDLNADTNPGIWSTTFTPNATAFKFVASNPLGNVASGAASGLQIKVQTKQTGNAAGNLYANRFTAFSSTLMNNGKYQLLTSNQVTVRVVGFSLGDLIWFDLDNDGKYTPGVDKTAPAGVKVEVHRADGSLAPGGAVTTDKNGRWVVNDLEQGDYHAVVPASQFAPGGPLAGYVPQTVGYQSDPNTDKNEDVDHNGAAQGDGSMKTGNIRLSATVSGSTITGDEPLGDNVANLQVTPGTTDRFTNFTLDMALRATPGYTFTKKASPASGTAVAAGGKITYTLTGTNTGMTPVAAEIRDDLTHVIDAADVTTEPVATIAGATDVPAPVRDGANLAWKGTLQPGQTVTVTYTVTVHADAAGATVRNHATSTAKPPFDPIITPPDVKTEHPVPGFTFDKVSDPASKTAVAAGGEITYTLTGVNTGATALDPVTITDDLSKVLSSATLTDGPRATITGPGAGAAPTPTVAGDELTWTGSLQPGQTVTVTYTVTVDEDAAGAVIENRASGSATPPGLPPITPPAVTTEHPVPGYTFTKTSDPASGTPVLPGGTITYTLTGENTGATALDPVNVTDDLAGVLAHATVTSDPVATIDGEDAVPAATVQGTTLTWTGALKPGQKIVITYTVTLDEGTAGITVRNAASSDATPPGLPPITPDEVTTTHPVPGYAFSKTSDPVSGSAVTPGGTITYTLRGVNTGATALDPVVIRDDLSKVLTSAELTTQPTVVITGDGPTAALAPVMLGEEMLWTGSLQPGQIVTITYTVTLHDDASGAVVNNHATSSATPPGIPPIVPPPGETLHPVPGYLFGKTSDPATGSAVMPGETITYTLTGRDNGATALDPVTITDDLSGVLAHASMTSAPVATIHGPDATDTLAPLLDGDQLTWVGALEPGQWVEITYTVTVDADAAGAVIENAATSSATPPGLPPITPDEVTTVHPVPGFTFAKQADPASGSTVMPGGTITYTLTGVNTGATVLDPATITDDLSGVLAHAKITTAPVATIAGADDVPAPVVTGEELRWQGALRIGETVTITYTVTVDEDAAGAVIDNRAAASATPPGRDPITPPEVSTEHPVPGFTFHKSSDPASGSTVLPGETVTYSLEATNTGATVLDPVTITDDLSAVLAHADITAQPVAAISGVDQVVQPRVEGTSVQWTGVLQPGQRVVITYTVTVDETAAGATLRNVAAASATPPGVDPITPPEVSTEHPVPGYTLTKSAAPASGATVAAGGTITYTVTGVNTGATVLDPVVITDDLAAVLDHASMTTAPVATIAGVTEVPQPTMDGTTMTFTGSLDPGQSVTITYTVTLDEDAAGAVVHNRATSSATPPGRDPITPPEVATEHPVPGYTFTKTSDPASGSTVMPDGTITYTLTGVNTGATPLDTTIADDLAGVLEHAAISTAPAATIAGASDVPEPTVTGTDLAWAGVLEPGQSVTITYTVIVDADAAGSVLRNHASSRATPPGVDPITPPDVSTEHPVPGYTLTKESAPASTSAVEPGGTITYTVTGRNTGATVLDPVVITDDLSGVLEHATITTAPTAIIDGADPAPAPTVDATTLTWTGSLEPGQSVTLTYTVTLDDDAIGVIVRNHASSHATPPGVPPIQPDDVETWHPTPGYTFMKTADPVSGSSVREGDVITYTLTGANNGETVLDPVTIDDDLTEVLAFATLTGAPSAVVIAGDTSTPVQAPVVDGTTLRWTGSLEQGERVVVTYSVTVTADHEGETVSNRASSSATPPGLPPITPEEVTTSHPIPGYTFDKTSDPASGSTVNPGGTITYTLTGVNTGATALDAFIGDDLAAVLNHGALTAEPVATIAGRTDAPAPLVDGTHLSWTGRLAVGETVVITYTVTLDDDAVGVVVNNHASSFATPPGSDPIRPPDVTTTHPTPGYAFDKTSDPAPGSVVAPGETITYTLTGRNIGATALDPVVVRDDLSTVLDAASLTVQPSVVITGDGPTDALAPVIVDGELIWTGALAAGQTVTITYTVTVDADAAGHTIRNSATSEATPPGVPPITPPAVVTEHPVPGYAFGKASDPVSGSTVAPGDTITYTLTGVNTGATPLETTVTDDLSDVLSASTVTVQPVATIVGVDPATVPAPQLDDTQLTWNGVLDVGQQVEITYTVTVSDDTAGEILNNRAVSTATPPGGEPITPPEAVTEHPVPGYAFAKQSAPASGSTVMPGGEITYTLTGSNTGATPLDVVVSDDLSAVLDNAKLTGEPTATVAGTSEVAAPVVDGTNLTWAGSLAPGQSVVITYTVTVNDDTAGVVVRNHASSTATPPGGATITPPLVETSHPVPGYTFAKTSDPASGDAVRPGDTITYTLTGENTGATALDDVTITDDLSTVLAHADLTGAPTVTIEGVDDVPGATIDGDTLHWVGSLEKGQTVTVTYAVTVHDDATGVIVRNAASSTATPPGVPPITPPGVETWHPTPGYTFMKSADPATGSSVLPGSTVTYTLTGTNAGETVLDPVEVTDDLSGVLAHAALDASPTARIVAADGTERDATAPVLDGTTLTWTGALQIGERVVVGYSVVIDDDAAGSTIRNSASSEATPPGLPPVTPPEVVTEHPVPGYEFGKASSPVSGTAVAPGGTITYTLTGVNTGATELQTFITDDLSKVLNNAELTSKPVVVIEGESDVPAAVLEGTTLTWSGVLKVGQTVTITYAVTVNEGTEGVIVNNHASSTATPPGLPPITPPSVVTEHPVPGYELAKTSDPKSGSTVTPGQKINYTVTGTNIGATALDDVTITDDLSDVLDDATLTGTAVATVVSSTEAAVTSAAPVVDGTTLRWSGALNPGERVEITYTVTVDADAQGQTLRNTASSVAVPPTGPDITPEPPVTEHHVPGKPLPATGAVIQTGVIALGVLLLIGGSAIYLIRRRRADA